MKKLKVIKIYLIVFIVTFFTVNIAMAVDNSTIDENDPIVTQSYVELRVEQVKDYFEQKIKIISDNVDVIKKDILDIQSKQSVANIFEPITLKKNNKIIGGAGTEIVLRTGSSKAVTTTEGGILDITSGLDIQNGKDIIKQHLLIIPRNDGRGLIITSDSAVVMIKGSYTVQ